MNITGFGFSIKHSIHDHNIFLNNVSEANDGTPPTNSKTDSKLAVNRQYSSTSMEPTTTTMTSTTIAATTTTSTSTTMAATTTTTSTPSITSTLKTTSRMMNWL